MSNPPSLPGLTRQSIRFERLLRRWMDARAFASPKRLRPRRRVKPAHDGESMQIISMLRVAALTGAIAFFLAAQPALAQRGASCHGGQSFEQFLAGLKQQAAAAGASQGERK